MITLHALAFLVCQTAGTPAQNTASPTPQPQAHAAAATAPAMAKVSLGQADLTVRVIIADTKGTQLDPQLNDLFGSLKPLSYTHYALKQSTNLSLKVDDSVQRVAMLAKHTLLLSATELRSKKPKSVRVQIEIPELKFKTRVWIASGANLVVGGPKLEDGVLMFAIGATKIEESAANASAAAPK